MRLLRASAVCLILGLLGWLGICAAVGVFATEGALHPPRRPLTPSDHAKAAAVATRFQTELQDVSIPGHDGAILRAWSIRPKAQNGDAVILLHGQADNRAGMLGQADMLLRHGYSVLLPDARAHGESGGVIATYGVLEAEDVRRWFDWLQQTEKPRCIDGIGESMGAADLLRSLWFEHGYCAVVAESVFSTFREVAYDRFGQALHTGPWLGRTVLRPAVSFGFLYARWKYGVDLTLASPLASVEANSTPVLLIHGKADTNIPPRHSERIAARVSTAALWEPERAGHCGASGADPAGYEQRVVEWFAAHASSAGAG